MDTGYKELFDEIKSLDIPTEESNQILLDRFESGEKEVKETLIKTNLRLVISILDKFYYKVNKEKYYDLFQEGVIGLIKAIEGFNKEKGKFSTYASTSIRRNINNYLTKTTKTIRRPNYMETLIYRYKELKDILTKEEIIEALDITEKQYNVIISSINSEIISDVMNTFDGEVFSIFDFLGIDEGIEYVDKDMYKDILKLLRRHLNQIEYFIFYNRYINDEKMPYGTLGEILNVRRQRIQQVDVKIKNKIKPIIESFYHGNISLDDTKIKLEPVSLKSILRYIYLEPKLTSIEKELYYLLYIDYNYYNDVDLEKNLSISKECLKIVKRDLSLKINSITRDYLKNYSQSKIISLFNHIEDNHHNFKFNKQKYLTLKINDLTSRDKTNPKVSKYNREEVDKIYINTLLSRPISSLDDYYYVYQKYKDNFSSKNQGIIEYYVFNINKKIICKTSAINDALSKLNYYCYKEILDLEFRKIYAIVHLKYSYLLNDEYIDILDAYYSNDETKLKEHKEKYSILKLDDILRNARKSVTTIYLNKDKSVIDQNIYLPYIDNLNILTSEEANILKLYLVCKKSLNDINAMYNFTTANYILKNAIDKIDYYRFNINRGVFNYYSEVPEFINDYSLTKLEKEVANLKFVLNKSNSEISTILGKEINAIKKVITNINNKYILYLVRDTHISFDDIIRVYNLPMYQNVLNELELSYIKNIIIEKKQEDFFKNSRNLNESHYKKLKHNVDIKVKLFKIGKIKSDTDIGNIDVIKKYINDPNLPIDDTELKIVCSILELNNYNYKNIDELSSIFNLKKDYILKKFNNAIVKIIKYSENELLPELDYKKDVLELLPFFNYYERKLLTLYFKDNLTTYEISEKLSLGVKHVQSLIHELKIRLYIYKNNPYIIKLNYYLYQNNLEKLDVSEDSIKVFDLFNGVYSSPVSFKRIEELTSISKTRAWYLEKSVLYNLLSYELRLDINQNISKEKAISLLKGDNLTYYMREFLIEKYSLNYEDYLNIDELEKEEEQDIKKLELKPLDL